MRGNNTIKINQATMIEAVQGYFDLQMKGHVVLSVKKDTQYSSSEGFEVEFTDKAGEEGKS